MPTKAGKIQLSDLRVGKSLFMLGFNFFPAYRRVIPFASSIQITKELIGRFTKEEWIEAIAEERLFTSLRAVNRYMRLHGRDALRKENRANLELLSKPDGEQTLVPRYTEVEIEQWLDQTEDLLDWQIETFPLHLPMNILMQGVHIKMRSYVKQKILTGHGRDIMAMTAIEDHVARQVNQQVLEGAHEQPDAAAGQGV